jgi:hypothetical protein
LRRASHSNDEKNMTTLAVTIRGELAYIYEVLPLPFAHKHTRRARRRWRHRRLQHVDTVPATRTGRIIYTPLVNVSWLGWQMPGYQAWG